MSNFLKSNLAAFRQRLTASDWNLLNQFPVCRNLVFSDTLSGQKTAKLGNAFLHSPRDPDQEARRFIRAGGLDKPDLIVLQGFGLGYHAQALRQEFPGVKLVVVEPDPGIFLACLPFRDLVEILQDRQITWFFKTESDKIGAWLSGKRFQNIQIVKLRSVHQKDREYYEAVDQTIKKVKSRREINQNTLRRFGRLWVRNLLRNTPIIAKALGVYRLNGIFAGLPALILTAGPSLEEVLPFLPELRRRFVLVVVDTACRAIAATGISPDIVVVVDPQYWNSRHLDRIDLSKTIVFSDSSTHPLTFRGAIGKLMFCQSVFPLGLYLEEAGDVRGKIGAGGSVATFAWELARQSGAESVYFGGLDLGYPDLQTHQKHSLFEQRLLYLWERKKPGEQMAFEYVHDAAGVFLPTNNGGQILSDQRMEVYYLWFAEQMKNRQRPASYSLAANGAAIEGMDYLPLAELLKMKARRDEIDRRLTAVRETRPPGPSAKSSLIKKLNSLEREMEKLIKSGQAGVRLTKRLRQNLADGKPVDLILKEMARLDERILKSDGRNLAGFLFQDIINQIASDDDTDKKETINNSRLLYEEIVKACQYHSRIIKKASTNLRAGFVTI